MRSARSQAHSMSFFFFKFSSICVSEVKRPVMTTTTNSSVLKGIAHLGVIAIHPG